MQDLIRYLPAVIYEYAIHPDGTRRFEYVSEACQPILGLSQSELIANPDAIHAIIHPEDLAEMKNSYDRCVNLGMEWNWQGRMIINGETRWMEIRSNHDVKDTGTTIRRGIIQDITERREVAKASEIRYQSMVEQLPIGILIHKQGKIVFANSQAQIILGWGKDLIGLDIRSIVEPDSHGHSDNAAGENAWTPRSLSEQQYMRLDGRRIYVETTSLPCEFENEPGVQVVFRDITRQKQTEEKIKKNEMLLTQLFQNAPMAVVLLTASGKVSQVNKGFEEMFGYTLNELKDRSINDFIVPDELTHEGVDLNNLIASHRVISIETVRHHRNGRAVNVILYGMPVMLENQTIGIYGVYVDITERKRVEEELKIRNTELDNFVYKVSHDLRAPLSSILGLVNLARLPGNTDDPMDYIGIIGSKVEHLDHFIGDVLSHSKNLKMELTTAKVDFANIINETFSDLNYLEGAKGITKVIMVDGIEFYSDPWRIAEILRNLISNSIKYRKLDQGVSEIGIRINVDHLRAEISFADNGIGIDEKNLAKIFEMFYRATEQSDGSGIGLYIVKNAVDKLGGQISVASKLNQGTRFHIILPNRINSVINTIPSTVPADEA